jgi:predicted O-methyltransferase YrrM
LLQALEGSRSRFSRALKAYEAEGGRYIDRARILPQALVADCRFMADRYEMLKRLPKGAVCAEVGTDRGDFARRILDDCAPAHLHVFELDVSRIDPKNLTDAVREGRASIHEGDSAASLAALEDACFDWVYIDADHSLAGVRRDIAAALPRLKPGGLLVFNDYCVWSVSSMRRCGVAQAVNELMIERSWPLVYFAFQASGYFDVAVRKT